MKQAIMENLLLLLFLVCLIAFVTYNFCETFKETFVSHGTNLKTVCLYAYVERSQNDKDNIEYFLSNGLESDMHYIFIINGPYTVKFPTRNNIDILLRKNSGYDFGAWAYALRNHKRLANLEFDYYLFINASVKGPYIQPSEKGSWYKQFTHLINEEVRLVGTTINIHTVDIQSLEKKGFHTPFTHVQSMVFCMDRECLKFLRPKVFYISKKESFGDIIVNHEIGMSQYVLKNGWNISCLAKRYQGVDYRKPHINFNTSSSKYGGDPYYKGAYFGGTLDKYEILFLKTNRNLE